jgi:hypothetical protein
VDDTNMKLYKLAWDNYTYDKGSIHVYLMFRASIRFIREQVITGVAIQTQRHPITYEMM